MNLVDLTGHQLGNWLVLQQLNADRNGMTLWLCRCICGATKEVYAKHLKSGMSKSCGCTQPRRSNKTGWSGHGEISGSHWCEIKMNADGKKKGRRTSVPFEITIEFAWALYLIQGRKCALSGVPIHFDYKTRRTASLDRIDSSLGYTEGNVQWVHKDINRMKNTLSQEYFLELCNKVANSHYKET